MGRLKKDEQLFPLTEQDLRVEYEELNDVEEFNELTSKEMVFVWYYANQTSPYYSIPVKERVVKCLEILKDDLSGTQLDEYFNLNFPTHIASAIEVMETFNPKLRTEAKSITEKIFKNIKRIVDVDVVSITDMEEKKKYIAISMDVIKSMPELVRQMERGYGVKVKVKKKKEEDKQTTWDAIMNDGE